MPDIKLEIGEGQIQNAIAVAIAESFAPEKRDSIIRDIVRAHLSQRENSYDKETLLCKRIGGMIREMAIKSLEAQVEQIRPTIEEVVRIALGPGFGASVCDQLKYALSRQRISGINISVEIQKDD